MDDLRQLERSLWEAADRLRANSRLTAAEYAMPVLGLIFLRHATSRLDGADGPLFVPEPARYDAIAALPPEDLGRAIDAAMDAIEAQAPELLRGVLPRGYPALEPGVLGDLVRLFDSDALRRPGRDDRFGRIYEYFLDRFAMAGAQEGGEFFTPPSLVRAIVGVVEPRGLVLDPAVGSAGMFVQAALAIESRQATAGTRFVGQERSPTNARLARMNLAVHGLDGEIRIGNTFYDRLDDLIGRCDAVMANPPFNVDMVDPARLRGDPRLLVDLEDHGVSRRTGTIGNANYLWLQYCHRYLGPAGRAGVVMARSATDADHWERAIRQRLVETGDVDVMVQIGTNFFYTRALPCTLWFFDRGRPAERRHRTLMLDARPIHRVVSRRIRELSDEQLANLIAIVWLYRGQTDRYLDLVARYLQAARDAAGRVPGALAALDERDRALSTRLERALDEVPDDADPEALAALLDALRERRGALDRLADDRAAVLADPTWDAPGEIPRTNADLLARHGALAGAVERIDGLRRPIQEVRQRTARALDLARRDLRAGRWRGWDARAIGTLRDAADAARVDAIDAIRSVTLPFAQVGWLRARFPDGVYADVPGLCRAVTTDAIAAHDFSLAPGRYVGAAPPQPEDEAAVEVRLREIGAELAELTGEAAALTATIAADLGELLG